MYYTFDDCGCKIPKISDDPLLFNFQPDIKKISLDCKKTWNLICDGNTKGCFQLESNLGQSWAKKIKPRNIDELSALISLIRPSCLDAIVDGKNLTQHYCDRKNLIEPISYFHHALKEILQSTLGILVYQEQAIQIVQKLAGFDLEQSESLRYAVGKKKADVMSKIKVEFLNGCKQRNIINEREAEAIFSWIEKAQKYSFNASHGTSYAYNCYLSAYIKAHFPITFFTSWLYYSKYKPDKSKEMHELVNNAKIMNIQVCVPDFRYHNINFKAINGKIYYGLSDIKGIGETVAKNISKKIKELTFLGQPSDWNWRNFIVYFSPYITSTAIKNLIKVGALDYMNLSRIQMLHEYKQYIQLSKKEQKYIKTLNNNLSLQETFDKILSLPVGKNGCIANKTRLSVVQGLVNSLNNPPYDLKDMIDWIAQEEEFLLGISLTHHKVDAHNDMHANCTCLEFLKDRNIQKNIFIAASIDKINEIVTKKKDKMAFLNISDASCSLSSVVIFPKEWEKYKNILYNNEIVLLYGYRGKFKDSLVIEKVSEI